MSTNNLRKFKTNSSSTNLLSVNREVFFKEMYQSTFKELRELNKEKGDQEFLFKNLDHQMKIIDIETDLVVAQLKDKQSEFNLVVTYQVIRVGEWKKRTKR